MTMGLILTLGLILSLGLILALVLLEQRDQRQLTKKSDDGYVL
jgi:uncharacterized membrane protein affecting hemolysin expression